MFYLTDPAQYRKINFKLFGFAVVIIFLEEHWFIKVLMADNYSGAFTLLKTSKHLHFL